MEDGQQIPEPREAASHSGRLLLRMPRNLHAELSSEAERQGPVLTSSSSRRWLASLDGVNHTIAFAPTSKPLRSVGLISSSSSSRSTLFSSGWCMRCVTSCTKDVGTVRKQLEQLQKNLRWYVDKENTQYIALHTALDTSSSSVSRTSHASKLRSRKGEGWHVESPHSSRYQPQEDHEPVAPADVARSEP